MKRILLLSVAAISLVFSGCKKDSILTTKYKATIGTEAWSATALSSLATKYNDKIIITGTSATGKVLAITIFGTTAGTYTLAVGSFQFSASYTDGTNTYLATTGSVTISSINTTTKKISGTFHFTVANTSLTISITSGEFTELLFTEI